ncbi:MAG: FGGY-family carbohydrate kinase, partial [Promethearchaeota archaeon]
DASTTQLLDAKKKTWSQPIIDALGIPRPIFQTPTPPGEKIGTILPSIAEKTGLSPKTLVFSTASHDTGAAVAGTPCDQEKFQSGEWAYLSSGTWSLLGVELTEPNLSQTVAKHNFTNEGGVFDTIRLLKNTTGFWVLEECLKAWKKEDSSLDWTKIIDLAEKSSNTENYIDINQDDFVSPSQMIDTINKHYAEKYGQSLKGVGNISRVIFTSMVESYLNLLRSIEDITRIPVKILNVVGGGSKNDYLNQLVANKLGIPVVAGPAEATTIGNVLIQMIGAGVIKNLLDGRNLIRNSFNVKIFNPNGS